MATWDMLIGDLAIWCLQYGNCFAEAPEYRTFWCRYFLWWKLLGATSFTPEEITNLNFSGNLVHARREVLFPASILTSTAHFETHLPNIIRLVGPHRNNTMMSDERVGGQTSTASHATRGLEYGLVQTYRLRQFTRSPPPLFVFL
jgi:hypothetical protein